MVIAQEAIDVSVIIPAYNCEEEIQRTVESVVGQESDGFKFEIIVVDDGSTDRTLEVLLELQNSISQLRLTTQRNSGSPSKPRNVGIMESKGEYLFFLDSDDFMCPRALQKMWVEAQNTKNDIVLGKFVGLNGRQTPQQIFSKTTHDADVLDDLAWHNLSPTAKLCRASVIRDFEMFFAEDQWIGEDQSFFAELYLRGEGISILSDQVYVEVGLSDDGSNLTSRRQKLSDKVKTAVRLGSVIRQLTLPSIVRDKLSQRIFTSTLPIVFNYLYPLESAFARSRFVFQMREGLGDLYSARHRQAVSTKVQIGYDLMFAGLTDDLDIIFCGDEPFAPRYRMRDGSLRLNLPEGISKEAEGLIVQSVPKSGVLKPRLQFLEVTDGDLIMGGIVTFSQIDVAPVRGYLVCKERNTGEEQLFSIDSMKSQSPLSNGDAVVTVDMRVSSEYQLSKGAWGTFVEFQWEDGLVIRDRWGKRTGSIENRKHALGDSTSPLIAYFNHGYENLTLDVGCSVHSMRTFDSLSMLKKEKQ